jgi:hypothetical protein
MSATASVRWYYEDITSTVMYCERCYKDEYYRITDTAHVKAMPQTVVCAFCKWRPKCDATPPPGVWTRETRAD